MNEEIDEYDIYHQDFTTVSEWEVFIARIEEILNDWKVSKSALPKSSLPPDCTKKWTGKTEEIAYNGHKFILSYHTLDSKSTEGPESSEEKSLTTDLHNGIWEATKNFMDDSDGSPFPVSNWYGLKRYVMLYPNLPLTDASLIKLVMSSLSIAFANVDCGVPCFVKIREHWQHTYLGFYEDNEYKTSFDTINLKRISNQCSHLSGLVSLFKSKIASPVALDAVVVSTKFSYELKDLDAFAWRKGSYSNEFLSIDGFDVKKLTELPFGPDRNPIQSVMLNAIWPKFRECTIVESSTFSDIDPLMAPTWTITLQIKEDISCQLSETISEMMDLLDNNNLLMDTLGLSKSLGIVNPLHKITEAPITISKLVKAAIGHSKNVADFKGPIPDDLLMPLLYYVFPDAVEDDTFNYPEKLEVEFKQAEGSEPRLCSYVKTSPEGGLVWRLSVTAARLHHAGGLPYLAHLWYELTQELQYRWEHKILVPGSKKRIFNDTAVNQSSTATDNKLKRSRNHSDMNVTVRISVTLDDDNVNGVAEGTPNARTCLLHQKLQLLNCCIARAVEGSGTVAGNSDDDEFFDCSEGEADDQPLWDRPAGRLRRLPGATLKSGAPLYVPRTQDPAPKTEDQLEEDAELMVRLGDDARASELRARMMSASLLSDMEAFKAANPGAELCDFVRWYSPRDWRPEGGGALGDRMLLPSNPWLEAWSVARPVPAARQRRLFDERLEAERVLHFLRSRSVAAAAELLLPAAVRAGAARALAEGARGAGAGAGTGGTEPRRVLETAARELLEAEREACRAECARAVLRGAAAGGALDAAARARLLAAAGGALPAPARREFTLRVRDAVAGQVLRAALAHDMTLVGAFTERIVCL